MKKVLFVCLGNICRSPLAQGIAQQLSRKTNLELEIDSAGTSTWHIGEAPCDNSIKVALNHHIDISQQHSRTITNEDIHKFDYVIAMDKKNQTDLENFGFKNIYLLGDFGESKGADVPDPYFFDGFEGFEKVYSMIELCVMNMIEKINQGDLIESKNK
ncbi:MAG TPA: low molecular weight phosphotyrosine protein phosphatase [Sulfurovum sp.]|nr:low molecular weight phosphotyrosine protein phosphatase [Sulfurovum sp.]